MMKVDEILESIKALTLKEKPAVIEKIKELLLTCLVEEFPLGDDRPCDEKDFADFKYRNETNLTELKNVLNEFIMHETSNYKEKEDTALEIDNSLLTLILILCGENHNRFHWNTETTVQTCKDIMEMTLTLYNFKTVSEFLESNKGLFKQVLLTLRPKLLASTWKHYPAAVLSYKWFLHMVVQPHLSPFLPDVLPTALILIDDYIVEHRVLGIKCLEHIVENVTMTELKFHGHGELIYKALEPLLHNREAKLIIVLLPCVLTIVTKLETNLGEKEDELKWSRYDDILEIVLQNMELEHIIALREAYVQHLPRLVKAHGFRIIRWSRRLLRIFKEYLEVAGNHNDFKTIKYCLEAMENYLKISKPVVHLYSNVVLFMLFKTLYNIVSAIDCDLRAETQELTTRCIKLVMDQLDEQDRLKLKNALTEKMSKNVDCRQFLTFLNTVI